jgi:hypothetical protein
VGLTLATDGIVGELTERGIGDHRLRVFTGSGTDEVVGSDQDPVAAEDREFVDVVLGRVDAWPPTSSPSTTGPSCSPTSPPGVCPPRPCRRCSSSPAP